MDFTDWIGTVAAVLTTAAYFPQAYKAITERHTKGVSLVMYCMMAVGISCWLIYGLLLGSWPLILANSITLFFVFTILAMKFKHG